MSKETRQHPPIKCRYLSYRLPNGLVILLPLVHVEVSSDTETFTTIALLDSGATMSFIPYEIAEILNINHRNEVAIGVETAGGTCDFHPLILKKLRLMSGSKSFSEFRNMRMLTPSPERDLPYVILGRDYVFKRFHIIFRENIRRFELVHHKYAQR